MPLPRSQRLRRPRDFQRVFREGRYWRGPYGTLWVLRREGRGLRIGWSVRRSLGGAVVRNRVRRRLNEAYRRVAGDLQGPADLVFIPAPATVDARFADLVADLRAICGRAGLKEGRPERGERSS